MSKRMKPAGGGVQVFEATMDNPEDQDELNRRLRKPDEPAPHATPKNGRAPVESVSKKKPKRTGP